jgi:hypothetical protein
MVGSREMRATKRPQTPVRAVPTLSADRILEDLGGIAGLLETLAKGSWPLEEADFEAVFDLVVRRCRNEFGAAPSPSPGRPTRPPGSERKAA